MIIKIIALKFKVKVFLNIFNNLKIKKIITICSTQNFILLLLNFIKISF